MLKLLILCNVENIIHHKLQQESRVLEEDVITENEVSDEECQKRKQIEKNSRLRKRLETIYYTVSLPFTDWYVCTKMFYIFFFLN